MCIKASQTTSNSSVCSAIVQTDNKEPINAPHSCSLVRVTEGQYFQKYFHAMTSSWTHKEIMEIQGHIPGQLFRKHFYIMVSSRHCLGWGSDMLDIALTTEDLTRTFPGTSHLFEGPLWKFSQNRITENILLKYRNLSLKTVPETIAH